MNIQHLIVKAWACIEEGICLLCLRWWVSDCLKGPM